MDVAKISGLLADNFLFWLSRQIDYPLIAPDTVQVNFTFRCNLSCSMCSMAEQKKFLESQGRRTEIDTATLFRIVDETVRLGTKNILLIGGEPLLHPELFSLTAYARKRQRNVIIVTNGVLLDEKSLRKCQESVNWLSVSIDAVRPKTFERIRGANVLPRIISNLERLNRLREETGRLEPKTVAVCTIMNENLEELTEVARLCRGLGMEKVIFQPVVSNNADQGQREFGQKFFVPKERLGVLDKAIDDLIEYKRGGPEGFAMIANSLGHLKKIKQYFRGTLKRAYPCYAGYNRLQIAQDYDVYFCLPPDTGVETSFGDVSKQGLRELWFSPEARKRRRLIRSCRVPCLQWCAYRDDFFVMQEAFLKRFYFNRKWKKTGIAR